VALVDREALGRPAAPRADGDLERLQSRAAAAGERPEREALDLARLAAHARVVGFRAAEQLVGRDAERRRERRDVVEREAALARLQAAERRHVHVRPLRDLLEGEAELRAPLVQAAAGPAVDGLLCCLHGNRVWQIRYTR
jgi:hypothetical protein